MYLLYTDKTYNHASHESRHGLLLSSGTWNFQPFTRCVI